MTTLSPPYRVLAGRCIVDARDRLVARVEARYAVNTLAVNTLGMVIYRNEDGTSDPDKLRGLSPTEADALTHEIARVLTNHQRITDALIRLMRCPDVNMDSIEDETDDAMDEARESLRAAGVNVEAALLGQPVTVTPDANIQLLTDIRDFWAGGDCPPDLWARLESATTGKPVTETAPRDTLDLLANELEAWCESHGLTCMSADEMLATMPHLTEMQRKYLHGFANRWDAIMGAAK